jgi:hypothetical protein
VKQMNLIRRQEEAVQDILATPEQGKRAAAYGLSLLNRRPRAIRAIRNRFERQALKCGYSEAQVLQQWNDIKDMAVLEARAE